MILTFGFLASAAFAQDRGVIFSKDQTKTVWGQNGSPEWTPTKKNIIALEARLESYVSSHPYAPQGDYQGATVANALNYGRQYMGITKKGRRFIYLNAFCEIPTFWRKKAVQVDGGGSCYFVVLFNPRTNQFSDLRYNAAK